MTDPLKISQKLSKALNGLKLDGIPFVYNPLDYAWEAHADYLQKFGLSKRKTLFLGMNPGPWGMAQTGVPFGEVNFVKEWLNIEGKIKKPKIECKQKPVTGWDCTRSEVSGQRFWGFAQKQFQTPKNFFKDFMVLNYCPLLFLDAGGRNLTPDKLAKVDREQISQICDVALNELIAFYKPERVIGIGGFAKACFERVVTNPKIKIGTILHPSPASPAANRGWEEQVIKQLEIMQVL